ncbi:EF-P beta-lysylation protein EpmB [uncultured Thiothrix sp.]|uniref:EF-P beta-lysylation protein EpmB n=1 Tax=uncultured Thiothrix sp. TaxID=223185 RepID=UPI00262A13DF|nr:EF-P beta-lysylation protein EpmB [uncultured Thiothrix sp.]
MITGIAAKNQTKNSSSLTSSVWQRALASAVRDPFELIRLLELEGQGAEVSLDAARQFRLLAPHSYIRRMKKGDWNDPLLRQVLPLSAEMQLTQGFVSDPVGDHVAMVTDGVLHKYQGRVLLVTTGACAIHCRYCFRRHFPYSEANPARDQWQEALDYIAGNSAITEVLLSGGDPLTLSDERLSSLCERIAAIEHVQRIRLHTRLPLVLPERIDERLLTWLSQLNKQVIMVIHANHANEFQDAEVQAGLKALREVGVLLLNQSVLLRGVNDSVPALAALSEALVAAKVTPYYLHSLDRVQGAAHFEVPESEAKLLIEQLRLIVPGYMVPQLVREVAGEGAKTPV